MPEFDNPFKPESVLTLHTNGGLALELQTRLSIDNINYKADGVDSSFSMSGIHFKESFPNDLPNCWPEWITQKSRRS